MDVGESSKSAQESDVLYRLVIVLMTPVSIVMFAYDEHAHQFESDATIIMLPKVC